LAQALRSTGDDLTLQDLMQLDPEMLPHGLASNQKLAKRAQMHLFAEYLKDELSLHMDELTIEQKQRLLWINGMFPSD